MSSQRLTDLMQSPASENDIQFYFITKSGQIDDASEDLKYSFQIIVDLAAVTENLQWISEDDCLRFDVSQLTKKNVFVMEEFAGEAFDHLSATKAIVLGPRVLINCQLTNDVVPKSSSPIFTLAMRNVIVCLSGISVDKRTEIHRLVGFMGGMFTKDLIETTTHLITNTIKSPKYEKAALRNMKIMKEDWIFEVWNLSKNDDNSYATDEFQQKYKMPIFNNLVITSTGISEADKTEITKLINDNGGSYSGSFKSKETHILITQPNQKNSDKFKAAVKCRKECLMIDWVKDSVSKGFSLPYTNYRIYTGQSTRSNVANSTQITDQSFRPESFLPDASQLSAIMNDYSIAETTSAQTPRKTSPPPQQQQRFGYKATLNNIDIDVVKNAKGCLDGCTIWLCGFDSSDMDKLKKIVNFGGAIRIDEYGPNVEYVIVGRPTSNELSLLNSVENLNIVTVDWLVACINTKRIADPKEFLFKLQTSNSDSIQTIPSPASRKNIEAMNPFRRPDYVPRPLNLAEDEKIKNCKEKNLLEQYAQPSTLQVNVQQRDETGAETTEESSQVNPNLFRGRTFGLFGFSEESTFELMTEIEEAGGSIVDKSDLSKDVDFLIVPVDTHDFSDCQYNAKETVTELWAQQCLNDNKIVDIEYYHRAIAIRPECKPLHGQNIVFSTYTTPERDYLYSLARALGGEVNDRYMRNQRPILICPTPEGKKYEGAVKWQLPVVTREWLTKCFELKKKVSMQSYAVGASKCEDDEENVNEQNVNSGIGANEPTQKFEKRMEDGTICNLNDGNEHVVNAMDVDDDVFIGTPVVSAMDVEKNVNTPTPAQHPRILSIKNRSNRQASQSPKTPLPSHTTAAAAVNTKSPATELTEDLTPETRKLVYGIFKEYEENTTPLTKRRRQENVTSSPPPSLAELLGSKSIFEIIDRNYVEMPKRRPSTPFAEVRKRMYKEFLGDKYDGTPERASTHALPNTTPTNAPLNTLLPNAPAIAQPSASNVDDVDTNSKDTEKKGGDGNTQVLEFFDSIKKCRESRPAHPNTQQISKCRVNDSSSDSDEEVQIEPPQQIEVIDWRDPEDFFQSERFLSGSRSTFKGTLCFSISLSIDVEREKLAEQIKKLGGTVCEDWKAFDPSCTHLICSKPNQSEKTLSIIASGRWLLCPAYIEDSSTAGHFLNEEDYEWGNPKAISKLPNDIDTKTNKIASISHKRRKELQLRSKNENRPVGVFSGFRAILHINQKDSFKRLLEAGCGVVVDIKEPYRLQSELQGVTHCFVDKKTRPLEDADKIAMKNADIHFVTTLYLQACLQEDTLPPVKDYAANL